MIKVLPLNKPVRCTFAPASTWAEIKFVVTVRMRVLSAESLLQLHRVQEIWIRSSAKNKSKIVSGASRRCATNWMHQRRNATEKEIESILALRMRSRERKMREMKCWNDYGKLNVSAQDEIRPVKESTVSVCVSNSVEKWSTKNEFNFLTFECGSKRTKEKRQ